MALSKIDAVNFLTGTIPSGNIATSSLAAAATGKFLQVVNSNNEYDTTISSTSYGDVLSASGTTWETAITPSATSSKILLRDVAQLGSALRSGRRGRRFESCHPD